MATETEKALNCLENIAQTLNKTQVNLKKCPKARLTRNYIEARLKCLEDYWSDYKRAHSTLIRNTPKEKRDILPYIEKEEFYIHEELYIEIKSNLQDLLESQQVSASVSEPIRSDPQQTQVVLPKIQLPTFCGKYEDWLSFHDLFVTLVHNNVTLNNVQKLHYLKTSLTGEAASKLKHIQVTDLNYEQAWNILKRRYGNKRITVDAIMKKLFWQKKMVTNNSNSIKSLLDTTFECLNHLKNLKVEIENWDSIIIFMIVQKLDSETHRDWENHVSNVCLDFNSLPSLDTFREFLENRFRTLELTEKQKSNVVSLREKSFHITTNVNSEKKCQMCNEGHTLSHCKQFGKRSPEQRSEWIRSNNLCFNCLAPGHSVRQCRIPTCCRLCKRRHHTLLHENKDVNVTKCNNESNIQQHEVTPHTNIEKIKEGTTIMTSHAATERCTALLATAFVRVRSEDNYTITLRALIDQGSQASFISERAAQQIKAKRYPIRGTVVGVGSTREDIRQVVQINVESICDETFSLNINTYVMSKQLTTKIPSRKINTTDWPHLEGLILADPNYFKPGTIDLLLGVDVYARIVQNDLIKGPPGSPCAHKTNLGWILFGEVEDKPLQSNSVVVAHHQVIAEDFLKTLWEIEPDTRRKYTKEEEQCESFYEETYKRDNNGRFIVRLPFRTNYPISPEGKTRDIAMKRLIQQEHRLQKIPELREEYDKVLEEYLEMGHMEEVPNDEINNRCVYLPHHAVVRREKETTRLRVVFDASCKGINGVSLNDELAIGPPLQEDMRNILMRWRMHKVCFASDVMKMYRMVIVDKKDTDYQRILWRKKGNITEDSEEVKDYRLKTVTFGTACAPYLAIKTLKKIAEEEGGQCPEALKIILEDFYVDDLISGCDTTEQAIHVAKQITNILQRGGFELQKWASNDSEFLKSIDAKKVTTKVNIDLKLDGTIKTLGLSWSLEKDEFHYQLHLEPVPTSITKRNILSDLHKLYDPLGWIAPVIVKAKILVQKLWLEGVGWDEEISKELEQQWKQFREDVETVNDIKLKRWLNTLNIERDTISLHGFCDASEKAYAAVVYCRVHSKDGNVKTNLVAARTKVAPVKTISLPRLELSGATLLAKLLQKVSEAMRISAQSVFAWTDSTIVLAWLRGEPNRWKPFVANRVVEILELTNSSQWYHVQSTHNPADVASRGTSMSELKENLLWWNGPIWLSDENIEYAKPSMLSTDIERKKNIQSYVNITQCQETVQNHIKFEDFDTLTNLLRVIVHCKRFLNMKKDPERLKQNLTTEEIQGALNICIRRIQEEEFSDEIRNLKENKLVRNTSILKSLNPFMDDDHILRVGGRLRNADVDENLKHPVILGKRNSLVPLILADAHLKTLHGGINLMSTYLMSKYWIIGCKGLVKQFIHKCLTCARQRATKRQMIMGDLPKARVTPSRPFSRSGVDFAGPVYVLNSKGRGAKTSKAYICIFICMAVKAIHLELVSDLTSEAFIAAFKRFVARRGRCKEIWSDNGTNFVASNKELASMWQEAGLEIPGTAATELANDGTQWHFTPPYSPNFGGLWEAGVKSVKQHLRKILTSNLTFEEFATVLTQIEACLNSRPLLPLSTDVDLIDDIQVLTPGHFIIGEAPITIPDRDYTNYNINLLSRWQHTQRLVQAVWKRWQTEYLSRLNQRPKWLKNAPEFAIGDIVLLKDENMPPCRWALARILEKHPGPDNNTRVYTIRYNGKSIRRSVSNLCPLPISRD